MKIRDWFALPFLFIGLLADMIAVIIGGRWTAECLLGWKFKKYGGKIE